MATWPLEFLLCDVIYGKILLIQETRANRHTEVIEECLQPIRTSLLQLRGINQSPTSPAHSGGTDGAVATLLALREKGTQLFASNQRCTFFHTEVKVSGCLGSIPLTSHDGSVVLARRDRPGEFGYLGSTQSHCRNNCTLLWFATALILECMQTIQVSAWSESGRITKHLLNNSLFTIFFLKILCSPVILLIEWT